MKVRTFFITLLCLLAVNTPASSLDNQDSLVPRNIETSTYDLAIVDGEITIETKDGAVSNELKEQVEQQNQIQELISSANIDDYALAQNNTINLIYHDPQPPQDVKDTINRAAQDWSNVLDLNPDGPVTAEIFWTGLNNDQALGFGGSRNQYKGSVLPNGDHYYSAALTNTLLSGDFNGDIPEISLTLNSDLYSQNVWHIGTGTNIQSGQIDLYTIAIHEIAHGLGFHGTAYAEDTINPTIGDYTNIYDSLVLVDGIKLLDKTNPSYYLDSNNLDIKINNGTYKVYAPYIWRNGSSFSHFDEYTYPAGQPGAMMTPIFRSGEITRDIDFPILGVMSSMGWPIALPPPPATIISTSADYMSITASWDYVSNTQSGKIVATRIRAIKDGQVISSKLIEPSNKSTKLSNLENNTEYTLEITTINDYGSQTVTKTVKTLKLVSQELQVSKTPLDGQIGRLYMAYFLREPDQSGLLYWKKQVASGTSLLQVSNIFADSPEFKSRYGILNNEQFVELIYENVLHRTADTQGKNYWINQLNSGKSRGEVMLGFSESPEFIKRTSTLPPNNASEGKIVRLYSAVFNRFPDEQGLLYWQNVLNSGTSLEKIATYFTQSTEFQKRYGSLSNSQFVSQLYKNVLNREPDSTGYQFWLSQLSNGLSRSRLIIEFSNSIENIVKTGWT